MTPVWLRVVGTVRSFSDDELARFVARVYLGGLKHGGIVGTVAGLLIGFLAGRL